MLRKNTPFAKGFKDGTAIGLGYLAVSFSFGIAAVKLGISWIEATVISATNVTSAGQFAAIQIIASGAGLYELILSQLIINARYFLMSAALTQNLPENLKLWKKLLIGYMVTDEIFGISINYPSPLEPRYSYGAMIPSFIGWTCGTLLGALAGNILPIRLVSALSVMLYGMFIAIFVPPAKENRQILITVILGMGLSALFFWLPYTSQITPGLRIVILTVIVSAFAAVVFPIKEADNEN